MKRITSIAVGIATAALTASALAPAATAAPVAQKVDVESSAASRAPAGTDAYGVTFNNVLVKFELDGPSPINRFGPIQGLDEGERIVGIDMRPANGLLYAVTSEGRLATIALRTQALTEVDTLDVPLSGSSFGVDFNPAADALRIVSNTGQNLRYAFATGTTTADTPLNEPPTAGTKQGIRAAAYTNNDNAADTGTQLLDIDVDTDRLLVQSPANSGQLASQGTLRRDVVGDVSMDIYSRVDGDGVTQDNAGYAVVTMFNVRTLVRVNLLTGALTEVGAFPATRRVRDFAIRLPQNL